MEHSGMEWTHNDQIACICGLANMIDWLNALYDVALKNEPLDARLVRPDYPLDDVLTYRQILLDLGILSADGRLDRAKLRDLLEELNGG